MYKEVKNFQDPAIITMDSFRHGYMNACSEVSRVMVSTPDMNVQLGKSVMIHLGGEYNLLLQMQNSVSQQQQQPQQVSCSAPMSPASSGYHSDECDEDKISCAK